MSNSKRPKAFFLNGGMGRIISAIPALEKYYEAKEDPDFIIVIEGICNIMNGHPTLDNKTYDMYHKNLFHTKLINMDIVSPEPYRLNEYFNQKCDIAQAFDMLINKKGIRELPAPTLILSKEELLEGRKAIDEIKKKVKKEKLVIIQPFGRAITQIDNSFVDKSNRSIEFSNLKQIIKKLQEKDWAVCIMSEFGIEFKDAGFNLYENFFNGKYVTNLGFLYIPNEDLRRKYIYLYDHLKKWLKINNVKFNPEHTMILGQVSLGFLIEKFNFKVCFLREYNEKRYRHYAGINKHRKSFKIPNQSLL